MTIEALRDIVSGLHRSAHALAAVGAALDARASGNALDPTIEPHLDEVVKAIGVREALEGVTPVELQSLLGEIRTFGLTNAKLLFAASRGPGWAHPEPDILQAAGDVSVTFPHRLKNAIAPKLEGLADRLDSPGASFLDIGVGVAVMSIEMARLWPSLRVVGIDPWRPALDRARENVRGAGLEARIELRQQRGEELPDVDTFDLAWIPGIFMPERAIPVVVQRVHRAMRPGGWLLFPTLSPAGDRLTASLARLRTAMFGGFVTTPERVEHLLREQAFVDVRTLPSSPNAFAAMIAARRRPTV